ncbi:NADPH-dependent FMN reductase [Lentibacillus amyloliquefaciens]|uniref:NADH-dependent FMN reductase n=1 Tax=Lentibacillus amyloliquefaciens TaxID=1472767 RepID=A0A0U4FMZ0_9BACI|nr:NAD(P)H-dependent oxidoreductase [Lentibacillus amyloliquefaciens]ALX50014.1 NADH-dependent FMN reductase [Lentibacillus amyloliquefaciens]
MKLVGVSGTLAGNKTSKAVYDVLAAAKMLDKSVEIELIDLRDYDLSFADGSPLAYFEDDTWPVAEKIMSADCLVFGTPIYQASISGVLKNLLDHIPEYAFKNKVTGIVATGLSEKHFLVTEYQLKPILSYFKGLVPTENVFVQNDCFSLESEEIIDNLVAKRLHNLADEILFLQGSINERMKR